MVVDGVYSQFHLAYTCRAASCARCLADAVRDLFFLSPSVLNTGNSKNNFNETEIKKLSTSLGSVNCDTQTHRHTHTFL